MNTRKFFFMGLAVGMMNMILLAAVPVLADPTPRVGISNQIPLDVSRLSTTDYTVNYITTENLSNMVYSALWPQAYRPVQWSLVQGAVYDVSDGGDLTNITTAANIWGNISNTDFSFQKISFDGSWGLGDGPNEVGFLYDYNTWTTTLGLPSNAIGVTYMFSQGSEYKEFDTLLNGVYFYWYADSNDQFYSRSDAMNVGHITLHELGHSAGLVDLYNPGAPGYQAWMGSGNDAATMYGYSGPHNEDMSLSWQDEGAMRLAYPVPEPAALTLLAGAGMALVLLRRKFSQ